MFGRKILCVAGSGDIPIYFSFHEPELLVAVDVSVKACWLTEIKRAAYRRLNRQEFCHFFFHGIAEAKALWAKVPTPWSSPFPQRTALYGRLRDDLSAEARRFFDAAMDAQADESNPFSTYVRPTDTPHISLLPSVQSDDAYRLWSHGARRHFPTIPSRLEDVLSTTEQTFHFIYTSNIVEYLRTQRVLGSGFRAFRKTLGELWHALDRVLLPEGSLGIYVFQGCGTKPFERFLKEIAPAPHLGYKSILVPIVLRPSTIPGTLWRHVLLLFQKERKAWTRKGVAPLVADPTADVPEKR
ncbi:MAG: DUF3419 family protein [Desulfosoma sp.]|uniref:DUF3419 family protein n=1 Tax=Desulfosoma sp. TaxID=2603217 RepID=UPI00404A2825